MMHLYVLARANKPEMDRWTNDLLAQYLPFEYEKGKVGDLQLGVRPIQLFEIVFPKKHYERVLGAVSPYDKRSGVLAALLRKILRLKPIKEGIKPSLFKSRHPHVSVIGIGVKEDRIVNGIEEI